MQPKIDTQPIPDTIAPRLSSIPKGPGVLITPQEIKTPKERKEDAERIVESRNREVGFYQLALNYSNC